MANYFWNKIEKPIIGLAPMDGITDASFRHIITKHSKPSVIYTEFVNVEGLARGAISMLDHFIYTKNERPIVAQIYGIETESFYKVALMACYLGFDGIDINMGCPANKVARRNSGAGLIRVPDQAKKIVKIVKKACLDWHNGITLEEAGIRPKIINALEKMRIKKIDRNLLPVSIKTRTGIDNIVAEEWIKHLLETEPVAITMHGRTLKQMYTGEANWEVLGKIAKIVKKQNIIFLGNGDVQSLDDAHEKIKKYGTDGVLVGRATLGNPWFFTKQEISMKNKFKVAIEHSKYYEKNIMEHNFFAMRKHLAWYCKGFDGAKELRKNLMQSTSTDEVKKIFNNFIKNEHN